MKKHLLLLALALTLPLSAQNNGTQGRWVDPVTSTKYIAANPAAWNNKQVAVAASFHPPVKSPDGYWISHTSFKGQRLAVRLTADAYAYYLERKKLHAPAIYLGIVQPVPSDGSLRLNLLRGLTTARHRPAVTAAGKPAPNSPPLKRVP